jgi:hypothetical protein
LPALETVEHVVSVFFDKVPTVPKMLHRATFMNALLLPPNHPNFPVGRAQDLMPTAVADGQARALLHGIMGVTAPFLPPMTLATRAYFPVGASFRDIVHPTEDFESHAGGTYRNFSSAFHATAASIAQPTTPMSRFQMWHRRKALQSLAIEFDNGQRLLQAVQGQSCRLLVSMPADAAAQVLACVIDAYNAWWTDLWMEAGACVRMAVPLLLNEAPKVAEDTLPQFRHVLIPPAKDEFEQACRDRTWWMVYSIERSVNMSTAWAESLHDAEITVQLPVTQALFDRAGENVVGTQTFQSSDLFGNHPAHHADGFVIYIKALKLWTDVARFFRQYGRGKHTVAGYLSHPSLRLFFSQINSFRLSFPPHLRKLAQATTNAGGGGSRQLDVDLLTGLLISHACVAFLVSSRRGVS